MEYTTPEVQPPDLRDYYADLGVPQTASAQDIKRAHHKLVMQYHPDKQGSGAGPDAHEFRRVREAFEHLRDEVNRSIYNAIYPTIREEWIQYHRWEAYRIQQEELRREQIAKAEQFRQEQIARAEKLRQEQIAKAEELRQRREKERLAREHREREKREARHREAMRRAREAQRAAEKAEMERVVRQWKEELAMKRSQEVARKAREQQEQMARERLREQKEQEAAERSSEVARKAERERELAAKERLKSILRQEKQDVIASYWAKFRVVPDDEKTNSYEEAIDSIGHHDSASSFLADEPVILQPPHPTTL
ncbi:DnaJ-domain-containing protein [Aaosphaeria arxii CBS 175.79]|uniref:DnaJ-domain-containing protein n=1 Tax=Aaosphaeria arxii CBS 175.79 TaxID=1450172 RepID=A0A6A5XXY2_9PLEO|nr:DnaJ-domain-containing protein [Aaosphaeria arxii CBS 175.79]KAF2017809.1 DnaJ-domain-containing protein [Aaosphaeria arxii CBS 175.79]